MKLILIILILLSFSCGQSSSPEGRSTLRDEALQSQIDSLKAQNKAILDSIVSINKTLRSKEHQ